MGVRDQIANHIIEASAPASSRVMIAGSGVALAFDCAGNAALNGDYRETISSRAGRRWPRMARFVNWLFADPDHCTNAVEFTRSELTRGL